MIGVVGYGRSGISVAKLISSLGETPFISDLNLDLSDVPYPHESGVHSESLLQMDLLVVSPGVPGSIPILKKARGRGLPIIGELEFASRYLKGRVVAITGTNGKTTAAALAHHILAASTKKKILLGGNIYPGKPLSMLVPKSGKETITVLEVSSFQLERIVDFHPYIAAIINVSPDHLDRHFNFEAYLEVKLRIFKNQVSTDYSILNRDDKNLFSLSLASKTYYFSMKERSNVYFDGTVVRDKENREIFYKDDLWMPIEPFVEDGMAASLIGKIMGVGLEDVRNGIRTFSGIPHRMETFLKREDLWVVNNSMCTNPVAFTKSLESFPDSCVIVGGRMKVENVTPIIEAIKRWASSVVLIGESSEIIAMKLKEVGFTHYEYASSMLNAVRKAAGSGDRKILLSPGGSSFDWYNDFTERGDDFKAKVREIYGNS